MSVDLIRVEIGPETIAEFRNALALAGLPASDIGEAGRSFFAYRRDVVVGYGGLECFEESVLLRSIVVEPAMRGRGYGHAILGDLLEITRRSGRPRAFLLTETAAPFFAAADFRPVDRFTAPPSIRASRQFARLCPESAVLMERILS